VAKRIDKDRREDRLLITLKHHSSAILFCRVESFELHAIRTLILSTIRLFLDSRRASFRQPDLHRVFGPFRNYPSVLLISARASARIPDDRSIAIPFRA
jgi:hypothetical protein